jgi:hypothetical protein
MAKTFYSASEAAKKLGQTEDGLNDLVREGKLREFRDAGKVNYKVADVDALAGSSIGGDDSPVGMIQPDPEPLSGSASGEILLESIDDADIDLAGSGDDILSLEALEVDDSSTGTRAAEARPDAKEGTVVPSVGMNVFDDDELDEVVDPLAQTAITDIAGLGMEGIGSGSGILDLTRESDDTSLGDELLEEIYTDDDARDARRGSDPGEDTRAGLDDAVSGEEAGDDDMIEVGADAGSSTPARFSAAPIVEAAPDAVSAALTALMVVGVVIMWFAGLAGAALVRGVSPSLVRTIQANLLMCVGGAALVAGLAAGITYFLAKRSS